MLNKIISLGEFVRFITFSVTMRDRIVLTSPGIYPANESPTHVSPRDIILFRILAIQRIGTFLKKGQTNS
jgi:transketolase C-terminal domain/subunit